MPFGGGSIHESGTQRDSREPPRAESSHATPAKRSHGQVNRQTAGEQANRVKDRDTENFLWCRPRQAFTNIEKVGNYKDREDRRLRRDQAEHSNGATRRTIPLNRPCYSHGSRVHSVSLIRISSPDLRDA